MDRPASESHESEAGFEADGSGVTRSPGAPEPPGSSNAPESSTPSRAGQQAERAATTADRPVRSGAIRRWLGALRSGTRLGQFLTVGILGAVVDNALLIVLHEFGGVPLGIAKLASAEAAILFMFACNERWTFAEWGTAGFRDLVRRVSTSNFVRFGGVAVATGVLLALAEVGVWYVLANVVGIGVGAVLNYVFESLLTWRVHRE